MIRNFVPVMFALFLCVCPLSALAAEAGSIEVSLPKNMRGETIYIRKEGEEAQKLLVDDNGIARMDNLASGIYQIDVAETDDYMFTKARVSIPMWSEEEQKMLYEVSVIPKYVQKEKTPISKETVSPQTGDVHKGTIYTGFAIISLIILVIISCHNRFACDTMTDKYSKNGGQKQWE